MTTRRRDVLRACGGLSVAATAGCLAFGGPSFDANCEEGSIETGEGTAGRDARWPEYASDGGNTSATTDAGPSDGVLAWRFATCAPMGETSPVVADGAVYVTANGDPGTRAIDARTGEELWTAEFVGRPPGPALADGRLFVAGHALRAFDADDGSEEWTFERPATDSEADDDVRPGPMYSAPTVADGSVYVCGGRDVPRLFALDATTGEVDWEARLPGDQLSSSPAVDSSSVYVVDDQGRLVAVDRGTGDVRWAVGDFGYPARAPAVDDERVLVADGERGVRALTTDGEPVWRSDATGQGPLAVDGERAYTTNRSELHALDRSGGEAVWTFDAGSGPALGPPAVADETVYVGRGGASVEVSDGHEPRGWVIAVDAATGDERWTFATRGIPAGEGGPYAGTRGSLAVGDGTLFACTDAGDLYAVADP